MDTPPPYGLPRWLNHLQINSGYKQLIPDTASDLYIYIYIYTRERVYPSTHGCSIDPINKPEVQLCHLGPAHLTGELLRSLTQYRLQLM